MAAKESLLEQLAELEHEQWMAWTKAVIDKMSWNVSRESRYQYEEMWEPNWVPYSELSEDQKEKDREWARKVLEVITQQK